MNKRWMIILMAVSLLVFGSMAFAGDGFQVAVTAGNDLGGPVLIANSSQASPQAVYEAMEAFGVEQEEAGQEIILLADENTGEKCTTMCAMHEILCCPASPSGPHAALCAEAVSDCRCECGSDG